MCLEELVHFFFARARNCRFFYWGTGTSAPTSYIGQNILTRKGEKNPEYWLILPELDTFAQKKGGGHSALLPPPPRLIRLWLNECTVEGYLTATIVLLIIKWIHFSNSNPLWCTLYILYWSLYSFLQGCVLISTISLKFEKMLSPIHVWVLVYAYTCMNAIVNDAVYLWCSLTNRYL